MKIDLAERRVVITGMGVIAPSGKDLSGFWSNVRDGISAAAPVSRFDTSRLPVKIAAEVKDFDVTDYIASRKPDRFDLTIQYGLAAAPPWRSRTQAWTCGRSNRIASAWSKARPLAARKA